MANGRPRLEEWLKGNKQNESEEEISRIPKGAQQWESTSRDMDVLWPMGLLRSGLGVTNARRRLHKDKKHRGNFVKTALYPDSTLRFAEPRVCPLDDSFMGVASAHERIRLRVKLSLRLQWRKS